MKNMKSGWMALGLVSFFLLGLSAVANADTKQIKAYKEIFPDDKPKCVSCHKDEKPKKEDGAHDLNDYGMKAKALADEAKKEAPDADTYKQVGQIK